MKCLQWSKVPQKEIGGSFGYFKCVFMSHVISAVRLNLWLQNFTHKLSNSSDGFREEVVTLCVD